MYFLEAKNIIKRYTGHTALNDVSIGVPQGTIFGLLGPNGAGKTTLIRILNQITGPDEGVVLFNGSPLQPHDVAEFGYLPEERGLYKKMKVGEQALYLAMLKGMPQKDAMAELKRWFIKFGIESWWNKKVEELSKGMQQKVQFIVTVVHNPSLLIFDEPFSGFDPINANLMKDEILELKRNGATIILSTHNMNSVEELCDNIALINRSQKILGGKVSDIRKSYSKQLFEVTTNSGGLSSDNLPEGYIIESLVKEGLYDRTTLSVRNDLETPVVLRKLVLATDIFAFKEILPTMDEIFVDAVRNSNTQQ